MFLSAQVTIAPFVLLLYMKLILIIVALVRSVSSSGIKQTFATYVSQLNWQNLYCNCLNVNECWTVFSDTLKSGIVKKNHAKRCQYKRQRFNPYSMQVTLFFRERNYFVGKQKRKTQ